MIHDLVSREYDYIQLFPLLRMLSYESVTRLSFMNFAITQARPATSPCVVWYSVLITLQQEALRDLLPPLSHITSGHYHSIPWMRFANLGPSSIFVRKSARFILSSCHASRINPLA